MIYGPNGETERYATKAERDHEKLMAIVHAREAALKAAKSGGAKPASPAAPAKKAASGANCGIAAGGFQAGNKCAAGGGGTKATPKATPAPAKAAAKPAPTPPVAAKPRMQEYHEKKARGMEAEKTKEDNGGKKPKAREIHEDEFFNHFLAMKRTLERVDARIQAEREAKKKAAEQAHAAPEKPKPEPEDPDGGWEGAQKKLNDPAWVAKVQSAIKSGHAYMVHEDKRENGKDFGAGKLSLTSYDTKTMMADVGKNSRGVSTLFVMPNEIRFE